MANKIYTIFSHLKSLFTKRKNRIGKTGVQFSATKRITIYYVIQVCRRAGRFLMFSFKKSHEGQQIAGQSTGKRAEEKNIKDVLLASSRRRRSLYFSDIDIWELKENLRFWVPAILFAGLCFWMMGFF